MVNKIRDKQNFVMRLTRFEELVEKAVPWFIAVCLAVILWAVTGCKKDIKEGVVIAKNIEPERTYKYLMPMPMRAGKVTYFVYIPMTMYDDEDYVITLHGHRDGSDLDEEDESFYVSKSTFKRLRVGQRFCVNDDCKSEPNKDVGKRAN